MQESVDPIEEERRLFFVACSRAKKELIVSFPLSVEKKVKLASVFVAEIDGTIEKQENNFEISQDLFEGSIKNTLHPK